MKSQYFLLCSSIETLNYLSVGDFGESGNWDDLIVKKNITAVLFFVSLLLIADQALAQDTDSETSRNAVNESKLSADNKNGNGKDSNNANEAVAKGLSMAEAMLHKKSPWGFNFSGFSFRGLSPDSYVWSGSGSFSVNYRVNKKGHTLQLSSGIQSILLNEKTGSLFNNQAADTSQYGLTNTSLSYSVPSLWKGRHHSLFWSSSVTAPTSLVARRAGLLASLGSSLALRYTPVGKVLISPYVGMSLAHYRYFTSDLSNTFGLGSGLSSGGTVIFNSPFSFSYGLSGAYEFSRWAIVSLGYGQTQRLDYEGQWNLLQSANAQLASNITNRFNLYMGYYWNSRYRVNTLNPVLSLNNSSFFAGVGYVF